MLQKIKFLKDNFSLLFLEKMSLKIQDFKLGPEEYVYKVKDN